jgi:hypothetical protein
LAFSREASHSCIYVVGTAESFNFIIHRGTHSVKPATPGLEWRNLWFPSAALAEEVPHQPVLRAVLLTAHAEVKLRTEYSILLLIVCSHERD